MRIDYHDPDEGITRKIKVEGPSFDGWPPDLEVLLYWVDDYIEWYDISDSRKVQFVK